MDRKIIGARINHLRALHNMTQNDLSERLGVGPTTISNYERGYSLPNLQLFIKLADIFGVSCDYFINDNIDDTFTVKLSQTGIFINIIPYYDNKNENGIILGDEKLADGHISLPSDKKLDTRTLMCTNVCDNTMSNMGIKKSSYVIVDRSKGPINGETALIYCKESGKFIVRKFVTDGPMIMLVSDGYGDDTATIYTNRTDEDYNVIGAVIKAIINI